MAAIHNLTITSDNVEIGVTWSLDGSEIVARGDGKPIRASLAREDVFALYQMFGTILNTYDDLEDREEDWGKNSS